MEHSSEQVCQLLERSRLLPPQEIALLYQRWSAETREPGRGVDLLRWLVKERRLTEYQANLLARGQVEDCFFGPYRVLERLTRGPLAGAYRVATPEGQIAALKLLPTERAQDQHLLARFYRQVRAMQPLAHSHLARIYQAGESHGRHFLVFEYLEGETLEEVLQRRQHLPLAEAGRLICQALEGVEYLHTHGRRHGDLRPATILLTPPRPAGEPDTTFSANVKVLHAGISWHLFWENEATATTVYQAPEQRQPGRRVDQRADIYSLGVILYHCLAGQPFEGTPGQDVDPTVLLRAIRRCNPQVPDGLGQVLAYLLAAEPGQRYPTAARAAQALQLFLLAEKSAGGSPLPSWLEWGEQQRPAPESAPPAAPPAGKVPAVPEAVSMPPGAETTVPLESLAPSPAEPAEKDPAHLLAAPAAKAGPIVLPGVPTAGTPPAMAQAALPVAPLGAGPVAAPLPVPAVVPPATPVADGGVAPAVAQPAGDWDVELISPPPQQPKRPSAWRLSPRDWFFLGIGAGATVLAMLVGMALALLLR